MNLEGARSWSNARQVVSIEQGTRRHGHATKKRIAILVYENCSFVEIGLIVESFDLANSVALTPSGQMPHYSVSLLSSKGGRIQCSNSISMETSPVEGASSSGYDALFIAGEKARRLLLAISGQENGSGACSRRSASCRRRGTVRSCSKVRTCPMLAA